MRCDEILDDGEKNMAEGVMLKCDHCEFNAEAWSDGNPYYLDASGEKQYAYHPNPHLALCTEVDTPHICMRCAHEFNVDSATPIRRCPQCNFGRIYRMWILLGKRCPQCKSGIIISVGDMIS